ncbi:MAG: selenide, water dikinase SelD [Rubripirellula sp.]|nr:selenide, water dikinase SelD [Rubripirellula sp.]
MIERLASRHVVLMGIGHTNAHVLRMWRMNAPPDSDLTCLSNYSYATYSGMLPARLAGQVSPAQMEINLPALCGASGARLITDPVTGIDHAAREIQFASRPAVPFDVLSIGIGSVASMNTIEGKSDSLVPIKPMQSFVQRVNAAVVRGQQRRSAGPLSIVVIGSGVAGVEITSCLPGFLAPLQVGEYQLTVVTRSEQIVSDVQDRTRQEILKTWQKRKVQVVTGCAVKRLRETVIELDNGDTLDADVVVWATGAAPPPLLANLGLDLDERGFLATNHHLESTNRRNVFAVGDTGTIQGEALPKAGVYAVRQGPVLWDNIRLALDDRKLKTYTPQHGFLKLINLGDGRAVGQWKGVSFAGRWVMRLKNRIDLGFMEKFMVTPMASGSGDDGNEMQCRGCGCKLGAASLRDALALSAEVEAEDAVPIGGDIGSGELIASTDFFSAPLSDAFTVGRIAALHSASDIVASGARVTEALANLVIPAGHPRAQQRFVADLLAGAKSEFSAWNAPIVGGHTIVGPRTEVGFTVIGQRIGAELLRKSNMVVGDQLLLTKPLGIGVLLAAEMRNLCPARAYEQLLEAMLLPQHKIAEIAIELGTRAATDVTGFGLIGHLIEMADASLVTAEVKLDQVEFLPSSVELAAAGIESSLLPDNLAAEQFVETEGAIRDRAEFRLLFDPQTCGGLLLAMNEQQVEPFQQRLKEAGIESAAHIGEVTPRRKKSVWVR